MNTLKFLDLETIKAHLRISDDASDTELMLYAESAEKEALSFMDRSLESLYEEFGEVPADVKLACLCRIGTAYKYREDVSDRTLYRMPYMWEAKLLKYKPADRL